ncbi:MAG: protocatechuate 3,4-dioxygenase, alpha subunit [Solirubrobacteraceae bacterium]|jgi:protocatechuate 3,4-dioxygenase alpha subunit|nr:protocatechuate 3,4-dioxygenase, alpha subunit [Solirubrobacteraceae bacterium]
MSTPAQTVGPYFSIGLPWPDGPEVVPAGADGAIWLRGTVLDGAREPIPDALIETWQADPEGRYETPGFRGFGRCPTDETGAWAIRTVKPGAAGGQAPHIAVSVFARGLLHRVVTRIYFPDEAEANAADPVLTGLDETARATLVAVQEGDGYRFDVRLQGPDETVFFAV